MKKTSPPLHPFLLGLYLVLNAAKLNSPYLKWSEVFIAFFLVSCVVAITYFLIKILSKERARAGLFTSLLLLVFSPIFSFYSESQLFVSFKKFLHSFLISDSSFLFYYLHRLVAYAPFFLSFLFLLWLIKKSKSTIKLQKFLNIGIALIVLVTAVEIFFIPSDPLKSRKQEISTSLQLPSEPPDIYYILLDGRTSAHALQKFWGYDNAAFISELEAKGFHVLKNAHSNCAFTQISLGISLDMRYPLEIPKGIYSHGEHNLYATIIKNAQFPQNLKQLGYKILNLSIFDLDENPRFYASGVSFFSILDTLINKTPFPKLIRKVKERKYMYHSNQKVLSELEKAAKQKSPSPRFIYAHLMMPHHPYYFDKKGAFIDSAEEIDHADKKAYLGYLTYCDRVVLDLVDSILKNSKRPPIIVVQGDHGFRFLSDAEDPLKQERFMILNALHLPRSEKNWVDEGLTPVNTFRMILNRYFNGKYHYLENKQILKDKKLY